MNLSLNNSNCFGAANVSIASSASSMSASNQQQFNYIYELPYSVRKSLCDLLDADGSWRQLGGEYMSLSDTQLTLISHALFRGASPTNDLLVRWEQSNPKVSTLFRYLASMKHIRALLILKPYVSQRLAGLCDQAFAVNDDEMAVELAMEADLALAKNKVFEHGSAKNTSDLGAVGGHSVTTNGGRRYANEYYNLKTDVQKQPGAPSNSSMRVPEQKVINKGSDQQWNNFSQDKNNGQVSPPNNALAGLSATVSVPTEPRTSSILSRQSELSQVDDDLEVLYKELLIATDDFAADRIIGSGGFGVVYRGEWKGTQVAIKRLKGMDNVSQATTELKVLNRYRIDNILPLYGISLDGPEACVVYQFMPNGSLEDKLLGKDKSGVILSWNQRATIGEGIARALNYLHTLKGRPLVHGDVKSANVLLDAQFEPKLGDFGLSRPVSNFGGDFARGGGMYTHITVTSVHGTSVYLPPEYLRQKILSPAVDCYSYGIVMLEMATGRRAFDGKKLLIDLVEDELKGGLGDPAREGGRRLRDPKIADDPDCSTWCPSLIKLGTDCAHRVKKKRPHMGQVLDFYSQCRTRDRIRRLSKDSSSSSAMVSAASGHGTLPNNCQLVKTPMEIQMWYDMMRAGAMAAARDSTVCPTIGSTSGRDVGGMSLVSSDDVISIPVPNIRRPPSSSGDRFASNATDSNSSFTGQSVNQSIDDEQSRQKDFQETGPEEEVDIVIPLLTELGISCGDRGSEEANQDHVRESGLEDIDSNNDCDSLLSGVASSAFSRMSTPPSD